MRITNQMMINNTMSNVQINKYQLNDLDTQLSTQKKINRPSDDPVIAIRALRLRSSLDQVVRYLDKNIPDAESWLKTTEGAIDEAYEILTDLYGYCTQGASDSYSTAERDTLASSLTKLKEAYYDQGNVDYAGRYLFTGYMTDTPLTYQSDEDAKGVDYTITQHFDRNNLETKTVYTNAYTNDDILNLQYKKDPTTQEVITPNVEEVYRFRLGYKEVLTNDFSMTVTENGTQTTLTVDNTVTDPNYIPADGEIAFNATTGEILIGKDVYQRLYNAEEYSFTYRKDNFIKNDVNPVMYYDCVDNYKNVGVVYTKEAEDIEYNINFAQKLKVNTEANDAFNMYLGRDIDDLINAVNNVIDIENQIKQVDNMLGESRYQDEDSQYKLNTIKEGLTKQKELAEEEMTNAFERGIKQTQDYQQQASLAKADVGNRMNRLNLTKSRLTEQKTNFTKLKSENEDIDLEEVVISYTAAELVYNASLTAASKVVQQTLLDFL